MCRMQAETIKIVRNPERSMEIKMNETNIYPYQPVPVPAEPVKPDTEQSCIRKKYFPFFGIGTGVYALFYAFCMYRNASGITYPFFIAGSLFFFCLCMKKLGLSIKKGSVCYMAGMLLLGVSTACTADGRIIFFNHAGALLLMVGFLLHQFYDDSRWGFCRYLGSMICAIFGSIGEIARPFTDFVCYRRQKTRRKTGKGLYVLIGLAVSVPLFAFVWLLLISADRIFMKMTIELFRALNLLNVIGFVCTAVVMFFAAYGLLSYLCERHLSEKETAGKRAESMVAVTVALPLTILYVVFSGVQIVCLFLGNVDMAGLTYAEYARQGFFQLLFVCMLNLVLVLAGGHFFKESVLLKAVLTVMSLCTYIMIFSSGFRMILYIRHYYLTFLRILVLWALVVIFLLLTGVLIQIFAPGFPLFCYGIAVVSALYILLSFSRPDYLIAACNLGNSEGKTVHNFFDADAYHDYWYLSGLCADAAPVILPFLESEGYDMKAQGMEAFWETQMDKRRYEPEEYWGYLYLENLHEDVDDMGIRAFNFSRYAARSTLKNYASAH